MPLNKKFLTTEYIDKVKKKLLAKVNITPQGCWLWQGVIESPKTSGRERYGMLDYAGKKRLAHRVSKALFHDKHILFDNRNILCCHTCDNPTCINPDHIFLGTHYDNNKDKKDKGRAKRYKLVCPHCEKDY